MALILSRPALEEAADRMLDLALSRGASDNISFVIVRFGL
jgi:serine/threonine protein phosphatase PrpC